MTEHRKTEDAMARIDPIPPERMTAEQRRVNDAIAGRRGGGQALGPFSIWLRTPDLAEKAAALGDHLRSRLALAPRHQELAILVVARHWSAQYEWYAHARHAARVGLDAAVVEAIRTRREPAFADDSDAVVYRLTRELCDTRALGDDTYARAVDLLGEQTVVDLVTTIGFYVMVAVVLVGFRIDVPGGARPLDDQGKPRP
jgi:4-carboxymuconolactone decarboxylase